MRSTDSSTLRIIDLWSFTSTKSSKRYIVEVEHFSTHILGLKFYWKGVADSKYRYSMMTNDFEPRTIIMSCVHIMPEYFQRDSCCSFGFVAANGVDEQIVDDLPNKRFRFYRRMMLSLFGEDTFTQAYDQQMSLYILINRKMLKSGTVSIPQIEREISQLYIGDYSLNLLR